jgi:hypothetical protein
LLSSIVDPLDRKCTGTGEIVRRVGDLCKHCPIRRAGYSQRVAAGGIIMVVLMLLLLPVAVMLGGAIWSALMGWLLVDDAEQRAAPEQS